MIKYFCLTVLNDNGCLQERDRIYKIQRFTRVSRSEGLDSELAGCPWHQLTRLILVTLSTFSEIEKNHLHQFINILMKTPKQCRSKITLLIHIPIGLDTTDLRCKRLTRQLAIRNKISVLSKLVPSRTVKISSLEN